MSDPIKPPPENVRQLIQRRAWLVDLEQRCRLDADSHWREIRDIDAELDRLADEREEVDHAE